MLEKISISNSPNIISEKKQNISNFIKEFKDNLYQKEAGVINKVIFELRDFLKSDDFSGRNSHILYIFNHEDRNEDNTFVSPELYLTENNVIVYEVLKPEKYLEHARDAVIIEGKNGKLYCETNLLKMLQHISLEEILTFLDNHLNMEYKEYEKLNKRIEFLDKIFKK